jgi:molecular chaperone GrpE
MVRRNGKAEVEAELDTERELPPSEGTEEAVPTAEFQKLKAERDSLVDRVARLQAEFENARKRAAKEQQDYRDFALSDAFRTLLPAMDSFERALQVSAEEKSDIRNGVELIYKQLQDAFAKLGLKPIVAKGETFDPHLHEAIEMVETRDFPDHQVIEELQKGYKLKDRLLRPAMVRVAQNTAH